MCCDLFMYNDNVVCMGGSRGRNHPCSAYSLIYVWQTFSQYFLKKVRTFFEMMHTLPNIILDLPLVLNLMAEFMLFTFHSVTKLKL